MRAELLRGPFSTMFQSGVRYLAGAAELRSTPDWLATAEHAQRVKSVVDALKLSGRTDVL